MTEPAAPEAFWNVGSEPGRAVAVLGLATTLTAVTVDVVLVGRLTMFFDLTFVAMCLALAVLVRREGFWTVGLLPPLLMVSVFTFLALVDATTIADAGDNVVQAVVSGVAHHSAALLAGYALCLGCLAWRARSQVHRVLG